MQKRTWAILCAIGGIAIGIAVVVCWQQWGPHVTVSFGDQSPKDAASSSTTSSSPTIPPGDYVPNTPSPQYSEVKFVDESFSLQPGAWKAYSLRPLRNHIPFQITWRSTSPVHMAVAREDVIRVTSPGAILQLFQASECQEYDVTRSHYKCELRSADTGQGMVLLILDARYGQRPGIGATLFGSRAALDQASIRNDAQLQVVQRRCVANCTDDSSYP